MCLTLGGACLSVGCLQVLALRAGTQLQIFNLELRAKMKSYALPSNETLIFWRWATPNIIALITATSVYHWSIEGDSPPQKLDKFDVPEGTQVGRGHRGRGTGPGRGRQAARPGGRREELGDAGCS